MKILNHLKIAGLMVLLFVSCAQPVEEVPKEASFYKPWESLGPLFHEIQMAQIFPDSKTFVDCTPKTSPDNILAAYNTAKDNPDFNLEEFVLENFDLPAEPQNPELSQDKPFQQHLNDHWGYLTRNREANNLYSTLIAMPEQYVVPGGRFREVYYWDSYFTMIGLGVSGKTDLIASMLDNFAYLIDTVGFIPNGNRTYYLGRSQPPFFASMVNLYAQIDGDEAALKYLPAIQKEYDFWMQGKEELSADDTAINRVVLLGDGTVLNRYWDFLDFPRPESHREDFEMAEELSNAGAKKKLYRNLRAGAESGWDYSTRWFADKGNFSSIQTIEMLPVDLNCLLYTTEVVLAKLYGAQGNLEKAEQFQKIAETRKKAIQEVFWNEEKQAFTDYIWTETRLSNQITMAGAYPLYFRVARADQAQLQAQTIAENLLLPGGVVTTTIASGQQWDYPNGWAPLQWVAVKGLDHYGHTELSNQISNRWLNVNQKVFRNTGKMMEKYNVADTTLLAGGGEYPTQDGFGWTNGVALGLMAEKVVY